MLVHFASLSLPEWTLMALSYRYVIRSIAGAQSWLTKHHQFFIFHTSKQSSLCYLRTHSGHCPYIPGKTIQNQVCLCGNLVGKCVDFSAHTVITGDPNFELDGVVVPKSIAKFDLPGKRYLSCFERVGSLLTIIYSYAIV